MSTIDFSQAQKQIAKTGRWLAEKNWAPATSSNYSLRLQNGEIAITRSGIDKTQLLPEDIIRVDAQGKILGSYDLPDCKPSAETLIHTTLYELFPEATCVLHTHSALGTRLSLKYQSEAILEFTGYEILKGFEGNTTHEMTEKIPIFNNAQDMEQFSSDLKQCLIDKKVHGFLIAGHGLYSWGKNIQTTQRHIESFEFLFECKANELMGI